MVSKPRPSELIYTPPAWKVGIEETRGAPRPWIFNHEEARRHRLEHPSRIHRLLTKIAPTRATR